MNRRTWKSEKILTEAGFINGYITVKDGLIEDIAS